MHFSQPEMMHDLSYTTATQTVENTMTKNTVSFCPEPSLSISHILVLHPMFSCLLGVLHYVHAGYS